MTENAIAKNILLCLRFFNSKNFFPEKIFHNWGKESAVFLQNDLRLAFWMSKNYSWFRLCANENRRDCSGEWLSFNTTLFSVRRFKYACMTMENVFRTSVAEMEKGKCRWSATVCRSTRQQWVRGTRKSVPQHLSRFDAAPDKHVHCNVGLQGPLPDRWWWSGTILSRHFHQCDTDGVMERCA